MAHAEILDSRVAWIRLGVTLLVAVMGNVGMWAYIVIMPDVEMEFGVSRAEVSVPYVTTMVGFATGNFAFGRMSDKVGITLTLLAASLLMVGGYLLAALSPTLWALTAVQLAVGFGAAAFFGPLIADISQWFQRVRGIAVAVAASGNYISGAVWPVALEWAAGDESWRWIYTALAFATIVLVMPLALLLRRGVPDSPLNSGALDQAQKSRDGGFSPRQMQYLLGLAGIGCCVAMSMPQVHIVSLCVDLGYGSAIGAEMLSLMLFGGVISRLVSGALADRLGGIRTLLIGSTLQAIALFLYLPAGGLVSLYVVSLIFGLSQGGIVPSYAVIVREYMPAKEAGSRVGFVMMMTILGMALGGWMSGWIFEVTESYQWSFVNGIAWNGMNIAITLMILKRTAGRRQGRSSV